MGSIMAKPPELSAKDSGENGMVISYTKLSYNYQTANRDFRLHYFRDKTLTYKE